jgi:hypothetical protein
MAEACHILPTARPSGPGFEGTMMTTRLLIESKISFATSWLDLFCEYQVEPSEFATLATLACRSLTAIGLDAPDPRTLST